MGATPGDAQGLHRGYSWLRVQELLPATSGDHTGHRGLNLGQPHARRVSARPATRAPSPSLAALEMAPERGPRNRAPSRSPGERLGVAEATLETREPENSSGGGVRSRMSLQGGCSQGGWGQGTGALSTSCSWEEGGDTETRREQQQEPFPTLFFEVRATGLAARSWEAALGEPEPAPRRVPSSAYTRGAPESWTTNGRDTPRSRG